SLLVSLTLSPALSGILFKPHRQHEGEHKRGFHPLARFFQGFNRGFDGLARGYSGLAMRLIAIGPIVLCVCGGLIGRASILWPASSRGSTAALTAGRADTPGWPGGSSRSGRSYFWSMRV